MEQPYVISEDIRTMSRFGNYKLRDIVAKYISQCIFVHCESYISRKSLMLSEKEITEWITKIYPQDVVVQTVAYSENISSPFSLNITRAIDEKFNKIVNQVPREGYPSVESQLNNLGMFVHHTLFDDVIYSGNGCKEIIEMSKIQNVLFNKVIAGITIGEGKNRLESMGIDVVSLFHFESVVDEVCQRDFIPGLPFCGRTLITDAGEYRYVPYLLPWGNPMEWASVPKKNAVAFSKACIGTTIEFWEEVHPSVRFFEVPAIVYDPKVQSTKLRFVDYLHQKARDLK